MLVLSRKVGERILIGDKIAVTVVRIGQGGVRIGIDAPDNMVVVREELTSESAVPAAAMPGGGANGKPGHNDNPPREPAHKRPLPR